jgi:hypothetical protein
MGRQHSSTSGASCKGETLAPLRPRNRRAGSFYANSVPSRRFARKSGVASRQRDPSHPLAPFVGPLRIPASPYLRRILSRLVPALTSFSLHFGLCSLYHYIIFRILPRADNQVPRDGAPRRMFARSKYIRSLAALIRGYPSAASQLSQRYLFPTDQRWKKPQTGEQGRYHIHTSAVQRAVQDTVRKADPEKRATCHTSRYSIAAYLLEEAFDIRTVQGLLCNKDVEATMVCTHVLKRRGKGVWSPMDAL